jgi:NitT/TauT family transport system substrate-binding protein
MHLQPGALRTPYEMKARRFYSWALLAVAAVCSLPTLVSAQLTPLNFVYTGVGGQSDLIRFTHGQGHFRKHGLDATMIYVVSGVTTTQAVASGSAPIANANATDALRAIAAGAPLKIIMVSVDQFQHLFVARAGIKTPKDMKGKRIAVSRYGAFSDIQTRFLVRQWGMDPERDVQILQIGNSAARAAALASGGVDGAVVTPGFIPAAKRAGLSVIYDLSTIPIKFANAIVIANNSLIKERPGVVKGAVAAIIDGINSWRASPEAAKVFLRKSYQLSDSEIEEVYGEVIRLVRPEPIPQLEGLQNAWESMPELKARGTGDLRKFVEPRFVEEVLKGRK